MHDIVLMNATKSCSVSPITHCEGGALVLCRGAVWMIMSVPRVGPCNDNNNNDELNCKCANKPSFCLLIVLSAIKCIKSASSITPGLLNFFIL